MKQGLSQQQYDAWIKPLTPLSYEEGVLCIAAPNAYKRDTAKEMFADQLATMADRFWNTAVAIQFHVEEKKPVHPPPGACVSRTHGNTAPPPPPVSQPHLPDESSNIDAEMTFDSFVDGNKNHMARAAAAQVADNPGRLFSPLYIFGGTGLGKTHLMHAIANQVLYRNPKARVRHVRAEQYVTDVVAAHRLKRFEAFKRDYHSLDVLLLDDIHLFTDGQKRSQEEFFYLFEALNSHKRQIVITAETHPKELSALDDRLKSRCACGVTIEIEPPELNTRVEILLKKAGMRGISLPDKVAFFIAQLVQSNVRELEGALRNVLAYAQLNSQSLTVDLAKKALRELLVVQTRQSSIENIQKVTAEYYRVKIEDILSKRRPANIAFARQVAMYLAKELTQKSLPEIGNLFGGRDHSTVLYAVRKIADERKRNAKLDQDIRSLEQVLRT